jgi:hypothetical protein
MHPSLSIAIAFAMFLSLGSLLRWTNRRNATQVRLDRGLRGYLAATQR